MLRLNPAHHRFQSCLPQEFLDREFPSMNLAILHNRRAGVFEVVRPTKPGFVEEICIIGDHPSKFSKEHVQEIRNRFDPRKLRGLAAEHRRALWAEQSDRYEEARDEVMKWRWFAKNHPMLGDHPCVRNRAGLS